MIGIVLVIALAYVLVVIIGRRLETRDRRRAELVVREQDRARAEVLLHRAHRQRQLAQLEHEIERRADDRLWRWGRGDWESR